MNQTAGNRAAVQASYPVRGAAFTARGAIELDIAETLEWARREDELTRRGRELAPTLTGRAVSIPTVRAGKPDTLPGTVVRPIAPGASTVIVELDRGGFVTYPAARLA
jgi:hypothetical protein